jgi:hypothetical protein
MWDGERFYRREPHLFERRESNIHRGAILSGKGSASPW